MAFKIKIERPEDIKTLNKDDVITALDERSEVLHNIFEEAGPSLDHTKVTTITVSDGADMANQIRARNAELSELGKRRDELLALESAMQNVDDIRNWLNRPSDGGRFAPGASGNGAPRRALNLGEMVAGSEAYKNYAKAGAKGTLDFSFDAMPSDFIAGAMNFRTMANTLFQTTAGWAPESIRLPGFTEAVARPIQLIDIVPLAQTGFEKVVYMEETTRTHAAAEKAEGVAFAESTFALTERESSVRKITDSIPVTDEQLEDVAQVESYLNSRLMFGLRQRLDGQILVGDGVAPNLRGIKNVAGIQTQAKGADPAPDAFYKAMTKIRVTGRALPTHHLIHPTNWETIRLLKTTDGAYVWGPPSEAGPERMWGLPIVQQDADTAGTGYVGSFLPQWVSLFERRGVDIQVGYVGSQFTEGKRTIRGDTRWAFVVFRPAAFCTVTGL